MAEVFVVKKKDGSNRIIFKPSKEEAKANRDAFFQIFPSDIVYNGEFFPPFITGFAPLKSNVSNAALHAYRREPYVPKGEPYNSSVTMDIKDFFPSVTIAVLFNATIDFMSHYLIPTYSGNRILRIRLQGFTKFPHDSIKMFLPFTVFGRLPQGFPVSPFLANIAFYPIDKLIIDKLTKDVFYVGLIGSGSISDSFVYTRYADDISVSWRSETLDDARKKKDKVISAVKQTVENFRYTYLQSPFIIREPPFKINDKKTKFMHNFGGGRRIITGIAVDGEGIYPPRYLKRRLRAMKKNGAKKHSIEGLENYIKFINKYNDSMTMITFKY